MKNLESMSGEEVGHELSGFGINLLVSNVLNATQFLANVFEFKIIRESDDYALLEHRGQIYQLHGDHAYSEHPLINVLPELGLRGAGAEFRLFQVDPDEAEKKAIAGGYTVLQTSTDKLHGLRECFLLDPNGYCWSPSVKI